MGVLNLRRVVRSLGGNVTVTIERSTGITSNTVGDASSAGVTSFNVIALIGPATAGSDEQAKILQRQARGDTTRERLVMHTVEAVDAMVSADDATPRPGDRVLYDGNTFEVDSELDSQRQSSTHRCIIAKLEGC